MGGDRCAGGKDCLHPRYIWATRIYWWGGSAGIPALDKFGTGTYFRRQNLGILKIYNRLFFISFWWYQNRYQKNLVPDKSLGTSIGKIWYQKKVSESVSEKFSTRKNAGIVIETIWYRKKVSVSVSFNILGTITHW